MGENSSGLDTQSVEERNGDRSHAITMLIPEENVTEVPKFRPNERTAFARSKKLLCKRSVFFAAELGEFLQLLALLAVELRRHFHDHAREQIAALAAVHVDDAFVAQFEELTALRSGRNFQIRLAFQRRHRDFAAERGEGEGDRYLAEEIVIFALKNFVLLNVNDHVKIARRAPADAGLAVTRGTESRPFRDAGGDL